MTALDLIRPMVKGCYDLQMLRMQAGLRLAANFRAKLKVHEDEEVDLEAEAEGILDQLRKSYKTLIEGIAKNRTLPAREGFIGDPLIDSYPELVLVHQFMEFEKAEKGLFVRLGDMLEDLPIYTEYLSKQKGIGPAMGGVLVSSIDIHKAQYASSVWKYAGLDVVIHACGQCEGVGEINGKQCNACWGTGELSKGRSRREEHLVERTYIDKNGVEKTRMGITYEPWLKTKMFVLASNFMRAGSPWVQHYRNYHHRILSDRKRIKVTTVEWKKMHKQGEYVDHLWTPGRLDNASKRYMIKMFLADFWKTWRTMEGLPTPDPYHEGILGHKHHATDK